MTSGIHTEILRSFRSSLWSPLVAHLQSQVHTDPTQLHQHEGGPTHTQIHAIEEALRETYFRTTDPAFLATEDGRTIQRDHCYFRYWKTLSLICPWLRRLGNLSRMRAIEVGCGTGSSTAAFARMFRTVDAFEIDIPSCEAAKRRLDILGLHNATIHHTLPELQGEAIRTAAQDPVHIFILFAVLEHMTISERIATLQLAKETLAPGGLLVIGETPNRLTYFDSHTSRLPFFHMLPDELAIHYIDRSPRAGLVRTMQSAREKSLEAAIERRIRAGTGVSYHEFEVALGHQVHGQIVLSGYEPEIIASQDSALEEALLRTYYTAMAPGIHEAFARAFLYFVLRMN